MSHADMGLVRLVCKGYTSTVGRLVWLKHVAIFASKFVLHSFVERLVSVG